MPSRDRTRVEDVMSTPLEMIEPDASLTEAARRMRQYDISALIVTTSVKGIVTSTDVLDAVAEGEDCAELTVADVMTEEVETVSPDLYMEEVAAMMTTYEIKHLPVVDDDYVGMISSSDVAALLS
ncbi:MAG: cyclic nucleotide-binding/CBS domain-containing protein [Halanaeroarchaeum sp.]